jgi:hypothetical protein
MRAKSWWSLILILGLGGCSPALEPPRNAGVCWRMAETINGQQDFKPFSTGVETLENCAAQLEGLFLANGQPITGAFQGRIIYVTRADIRVSSSAKSQPYRVFSPAQREAIDEGFRALERRSSQ